jgi:hypothetical protein
VKKAPQSPPAKVGRVEENRPQRAKAVTDAAKVPQPPAAKAGADSKFVGTDGEQAQVVQELDPPRRLKMPAELTEPTAHGHSSEIRWPAEAESQNPFPWKGLK